LLHVETPRRLRGADVQLRASGGDRARGAPAASNSRHRGTVQLLIVCFRRRPAPQGPSELGGLFAGRGSLSSGRRGGVRAPISRFTARPRAPAHDTALRAGVVAFDSAQFLRNRGGPGRINGTVVDALVVGQRASVSRQSRAATRACLAWPLALRKFALGRAAAPPPPFRWAVAVRQPKGRALCRGPRLAFVRAGVHGHA